MEREELEVMPFDKAFEIEEGVEELCHATGYEVFINGEWWNEYIDRDGYYHYGR